MALVVQSWSKSQECPKVDALEIQNNLEKVGVFTQLNQWKSMDGDGGRQSCNLKCGGDGRGRNAFIQEWGISFLMPNILSDWAAFGHWADIGQRQYFMIFFRFH
jgi:hypothetical protein